MTEKVIQLRPSSYSEKLGNYIKQLEEENEKLKEDLEAEKSINSYLSRRILKAIEYIENAYEEEYHKPKEVIKTFNLKNCTYEPSLVVLGILKGE